MQKIYPNFKRDVFTTDNILVYRLRSPFDAIQGSTAKTCHSEFAIIVSLFLIGSKFRLLTAAILFTPKGLMALLKFDCFCSAK